MTHEQRRDASTISWLMLSRGMLVVSQLLVSALLTRLLGTDGYGQFGLLLMATNIAYLASGWTTDVMAARGRMAFRVTGGIQDVFWSRVAIVGAPVLLTACATLAMSGRISAWLRVPNAAVTALAAYIVMTALTYTGQAVLQALDRVALVGVAQMAERALIIAAAFGALLGHVQLKPERVLWIYVCAAAINLTVATLSARPRGWWRPISSSLKERSTLLRVSLPLLPAMGLTLLVTWFDLALLSHVGTLGDLGQFSVALQSAETVRGVAGTMGLYLVPQIAGALATNPAAAKTALRLLAPEGALVWNLALAAGASVAPEGFRLLFSARFGGASVLFLVLLMGLSVNFSALVWQSFLLARGRSGAITASAVLTAVVKIASALVLVPRFGALGAAMSGGLATVAASLTLHVLVRRDEPDAWYGVLAGAPIVAACAVRLMLPAPSIAGVCSALAASAVVGTALAVKFVSRRRVAGVSPMLLSRIVLPSFGRASP